MARDFDENADLFTVINPWGWPAMANPPAHLQRSLVNLLSKGVLMHGLSLLDLIKEAIHTEKVEVRNWISFDQCGSASQLQR